MPEEPSPGNEPKTKTMLNIDHPEEETRVVSAEIVFRIPDDPLAALRAVCYVTVTIASLILIIASIYALVRYDLALAALQDQINRFGAN